MRTAELYLGDLEDFVWRRNALAKELRQAGDEDEAAQVASLKKPSKVAWALNQVSANEGRLRDELLAAAAALGKAQERLMAGKAERSELREAAEREQAAVGALLDGADLSAGAIERARQTLHAVALDEEVRRQFEQHRLVTDHEVAALGGLAAGVAPNRARAKPAGDGAKRKEAQRAAREAEVHRADAERSVEEAAAEAERAQRRLREAERALATATKEAEAARARLT